MYCARLTSAISVLLALTLACSDDGGSSGDDGTGSDGTTGTGASSGSDDGSTDDGGTGSDGGGTGSETDDGGTETGGTGTTDTGATTDTGSTGGTTGSETGTTTGGGNRIVLDPGTTFQTMTGWEVTAWLAEPSDPAFPNFKDEVFDLAINDIGINRVRLEVRSGVEHTNDNWTDYQNGIIDYDTWRATRYATVNDNGDPDTINPAGFHFSELDWTIENVVNPLRTLSAGRGEQLYVNLCYVAFTAQIVGGSYDHDDPAEYAELVLATYEHMDDAYGFVPDAWEVILEPDNVSQWNGTLIGQAIVAAAARLTSAGFTPRFIAPSNTNMGNAVTYFDAMVQVPGAIDLLEELSYHRYGGVSPANLQAIADRAVTHGVNTSMLEWWFGNSTYHVLHEDLTVGRNSAFQGEVLAGLFDIDTSDPQNPVVSIGGTTRFNRQYYKFVRAGAERIEATSNNGDLEPIAFVNAGGSHVVVVKAAVGADFAVAGLPAGTYGIKYTTAGDYDVDLSDQTIGAGARLTTQIPDAGVLTVYGK